MRIDLSGKKVLVTGASRGIGKDIAKKFIAENCDVAINSRDGSDLKKTADEIGAKCIVPGNICKSDIAKDVIDATKEKLGGIDIVICNVGSGSSVPPGTESYAEWQRIFHVNLWSTTNIAEAAIDELSNNSGNIVCISSICGSEVITSAPVTYSAAKAALNAYVRGISRPFGVRGVRINAIAPGNILFNGSVWEKKVNETPDLVEEMLDREVALKALGSPEDIANIAVYLSSDLSRFVTGTIWTVDGGQVHS